MTRIVSFLTTAVLIVTGLTFVAPSAHAFSDRDCADFKTQAAAQRFFKNNNPRRDPHRLDRDKDGVVCESLPCPCLKGSKQSAPAKKRIKQYARVLSVTDGDTLKVRFSGGKKRYVRLIGINTPERGRCWYYAAKKKLRKITPVGTRVVLRSDPTQAYTDRYGRLLRYVHKRGGRDVNRAQVYNGSGKVYVYGGKRFERTKKYYGSQYSARKHRRGLWRHC